MWWDSLFVLLGGFAIVALPKLLTRKAPEEPGPHYDWIRGP